MKYKVIVVYEGGIIAHVEKQLFEAAGSLSGASGTMMIPPYERDHEWAFDTQDAADAAYSRLSTLPIATLKVSKRYPS